VEVLKWMVWKVRVVEKGESFMVLARAGRVIRGIGVICEWGDGGSSGGGEGDEEVKGG
jgi:hypothetical protein